MDETLKNKWLDKLTTTPDQSLDASVLLTKHNVEYIKHNGYLMETNLYLSNKVDTLSNNINKLSNEVDLLHVKLLCCSEIEKISKNRICNMQNEIDRITCINRNLQQKNKSLTNENIMLTEHNLKRESVLLKLRTTS